MSRDQGPTSSSPGVEANPASSRPSDPATPSSSGSGGGGYAGAPITLGLTLLNVAVFLGEFAMAGTSKAITSVPPAVVLAFGGNLAYATLHAGRIDTLVASCFVHWGILHLAFNLYALRQVGPALERTIGGGRFSVLYMASGIAASMLSAIAGFWAQEPRLGAGASGAICGIIGATAVIGLRTEGWKSRLARSMLTMLGIALLLGLSPQVNFDNAAHAGGALAGALIAVSWRMAPERPALRRVALAVSLLTILGAAASVVQHDVALTREVIRRDQHTS